MLFFLDWFYNALGLALPFLVGFLIYWKWEAFLLLLTGDTKIHWSKYDQIFWCCFKCCGVAQWEWTRALSVLVCRCDVWPFCSRKYAGRNLMRVLGEKLGLVPIRVLVENVVVGDLPPSWLRSRIYLQVEVGDAPAQVSEVMEDCNPKVAHFNSRFMLHVLRRGHGEPVRFVVRELHIVGHRDVCECFISQSDIVDWAGAGALSRPQGPLRFRMYPKGESHDSSTSRSLPSWIFLEFTIPDEQPAEGRMMGSFGLRLELSDGSVIDTNSAKEFKARYQLLGSSGEPRGPNYEPDEDKVSHLRNAKVRQLQMLHCGCVWVLLVWAMFFVSLVYFSTCWIEYTKVAILQEHHLDFPVKEDEAVSVWKNCTVQESSLYLGAQHSWDGISRYIDYKYLRQFRSPGRRRLQALPVGGPAAAPAPLRVAHAPRPPRRLAARSPCTPSRPSVKETCLNLPAGRDPVMFPAPLAHWVLRCSATLTCQYSYERLVWMRRMLDWGLLLLLLFGVLWCVLRIYYQIEEKRAFTVVGAEDARCCQGWGSSPRH